LNHKTVKVVSNVMSCVGQFFSLAGSIFPVGLCKNQTFLCC
jgi:hypothetical protein